MSSNEHSSTTKDEPGQPPDEKPTGATGSHRPASAHSSHSSSGGSSSKHVKCIGRYVLTGHSLGKGNFARVEAAVHTLTRSKVSLNGCNPEVHKYIWMIVSLHTLLFTQAVARSIPRMSIHVVHVTIPMCISIWAMLINSTLIVITLFLKQYFHLQSYCVPLYISVCVMCICK